MNTAKKLLIVSSIILVLSLIPTIILFKIPFGFIFKLSFYITILSFALTIVLLNIKLIRLPKLLFKITGYVLFFFTSVITIIILVFTINYKVLLHLGLPPSPSKTEWKADLNFLVKQMEVTHPNLYSLVDKEYFKNEIKIFEENIDEYDNNKIKTEFARILALPNDAHSYPNIQSLKLGWHIYPINIYYFDDGIYITDAGRGLKHLVGSKIIKINDKDVYEIYNKLKKNISAENELHTKNRVGIILISEWLLAEKIIKSDKIAKFTLKNALREEYMYESKPVHYIPNLYWSAMRKVDNNFSPAISNDRKSNYWFEYRKEDKTLYLQYNRCMPMNNEPMNGFIKKLESAVNEFDFERFVIDLRNNDGGNAVEVIPLTKFISSNKKINQPGKLFVIIGRKTFSAAVIFSSMLQQQTEAIFVGEPTAQGPNFYSSPRKINLPNSKIQVVISTALTQSSILEDTRKWITPDIYARYLHQDFLLGKDPAMDSILSYKCQQSSSINTSDNTFKKICGKYSVSSFFKLNIQEVNDELVCIIDDHIDNYFKINTSIFPVSNDKFKSGLPFLNFTFNFLNDSIQYVDINWLSTTKKAIKVDEDYKLPLEHLTTGSLETGVAEILNHQDELKNNINNLEGLINLLGYRYLRQKKFLAAKQILNLNVKLFPESSNVYDSLAEAYMLNGETILAIENYTKSLQLNPVNKNAINMLEKLKKN
ncbi:S41 family peptidase [Bacteroidota bacterium]